jgi:hypothetical protein
MLVAVGVRPLGVGVGVDVEPVVLQALSSAKQMLVDKRKRCGIFQSFTKALLHCWSPLGGERSIRATRATK